MNARGMGLALAASSSVDFLSMCTFHVFVFGLRVLLLLDLALRPRAGQYHEYTILFQANKHCY